MLGGFRIVDLDSTNGVKINDSFVSNGALAAGESGQIRYSVTLDDDEGSLPAGKHSTKVNAESLESGIYFYTLKADNFVETKRMTISK